MQAKRRRIYRVPVGTSLDRVRAALPAGAVVVSSRDGDRWTEYKVDHSSFAVVSPAELIPTFALSV
jgi:hypothetical protein